VKTKNKTFFLALHHIPSCPLLIFRVAKPGQCCINVAAKKYGLIQKPSEQRQKATGLLSDLLVLGLD